MTGWLACFVSALAGSRAGLLRCLAAFWLAVLFARWLRWLRWLRGLDAKSGRLAVLASGCAGWLFGSLPWLAAQASWAGWLRWLAICCGWLAACAVWLFICTVLVRRGTGRVAAQAD